MKFATFHQAYVQLLGQLYDDFEYENAPRGFPSQERLGMAFHLHDAVQRIPLIPSRRLNIVFNFAETLWYWSGRDDLEYLAYYAPGIDRYTGGTQRLTGTAYGRAIFGRPDGLNQWQSVVDQLSQDPDTKRAIIQIFDATELAVPENPDVSCTLGIQFLLRRDALHAIGFMRANDVYRGLVSDIFSFTMFQELLAAQLGVKVGSYIHMVGSMHLYGQDRVAAKRVLGDAAAYTEPAFRFSRMPSGDNGIYITEVLGYEERLRRNSLRLSSRHDFPCLPEYWKQVLYLLEIYRGIVRNEPVNLSILQRLSPLNMWLVKNRWPSQIDLASC